MGDGGQRIRWELVLSLWRGRRVEERGSVEIAYGLYDLALDVVAVLQFCEEQTHVLK